MSKKLAFALFASFVSAFALAAPVKNGKIEAYLSFRSNLGFTQGRLLEVEEKNVYLDGRPISSEFLPAARNGLVEALNVPATRKGPFARCDAGIFLHRVIHDGKSREERGCIEDPRFARLNAAYRALLNSAAASGR